MLNANFAMEKINFVPADVDPMNLHAKRYEFGLNRIANHAGKLRPDFNWTPNRAYPPLFYFKFHSIPPDARKQNPVYKNHIRKGFALKRDPYYINYKLNVAYPIRSTNYGWAKHLTGKPL